MDRCWMVLGSLAGFLGVAAGAFGAHGLKSKLSPDLLEVFETAARYQMVHAVALLAVGLLHARSPSRSASLAGWGFLGGIVLFSGSLYALALTGVRSWGAVTPFGGALFLVGWLALAVAGAIGRPRPDQNRQTSLP